MIKEEKGKSISLKKIKVILIFKNYFLIISHVFFFCVRARVYIDSSNLL